jgi:hypothetical protein
VLGSTDCLPHKNFSLNNRPFLLGHKACISADFHKFTGFFQIVDKDVPFGFSFRGVFFAGTAGFFLLDAELLNLIKVGITVHQIQPFVLIAAKDKNQIIVNCL